eukprot:376498-Prorocentrum_minimum.AAC.1
MNTSTQLPELLGPKPEDKTHNYQNFWVQSQKTRLTTTRTLGSKARTQDSQIPELLGPKPEDKTLESRT